MQFGELFKLYNSCVIVICKVNGPLRRFGRGTTIAHFFSCQHEKKG